MWKRLNELATIYLFTICEFSRPCTSTPLSPYSFTCCFILTKMVGCKPPSCRCIGIHKNIYVEYRWIHRRIFFKVFTKMVGCKPPSPVYGVALTFPAAVAMRGWGLWDLALTNKPFTWSISTTSKNIKATFYILSFYVAFSTDSLTHFITHSLTQSLTHLYHMHQLYQEKSHQPISWDIIDIAWILVPQKYLTN